MTFSGMQRISALAADIQLLGFASALKGALAHFVRGTFHVNLPQGRVALRGRNSDYAVLRQVFGYRQYSTGNQAVEQSIQSRYSEILASGHTPVIVDAGANIGLTSLWFATHYPKSKIVAVEPDPQNFEILENNIGSSQCCLTMKAAVGSTAGSASLTGTGKGWATQTERATSGGTTPIVTINDIIANVANGIPFIVKIDIEGFERDLFSDNLEWLDETFAVFIEPHDWMVPGGDTSRSFQKAFGDRDFNLYIRGEILFYVRRCS
jgi:FkbM family methyltransferase